MFREGKFARQKQGAALTLREPDRAILRDFNVSTRILVHFVAKLFTPHSPGGLRKPLGVAFAVKQVKKTKRKVTRRPPCALRSSGWVLENQRRAHRGLKERCLVVGRKVRRALGCYAPAHRASWQAAVSRHGECAVWRVGKFSK